MFNIKNKIFTKFPGDQENPIFHELKDIFLKNSIFI